MLLFASLIACQDNSLTFTGGGERKALGTSGYEYDPDGDDTGTTSTETSASGPVLSNADSFWQPESGPTAIAVQCNYTDNPDDVMGGTIEADVSNSQGSVQWVLDIVDEGSAQVGVNAYAAGGQIFFGFTSIVLTESYTVVFSAVDESGNRSGPVQTTLPAFE